MMQQQQCVCVMLVKYPKVEMVHFNLHSYVNNLIPDIVKLEQNYLIVVYY